MSAMRTLLDGGGTKVPLRLFEKGFPMGDGSKSSRINLRYCYKQIKAGRDDFSDRALFREYAHNAILHHLGSLSMRHHSASFRWRRAQRHIFTLRYLSARFGSEAV